MFGNRSYPPGPRDGRLGLTLGNRMQRNPLAFALEVAREFGDYAYVRLAWIQLYFVHRPELIREVLATKIKSFRKLRRQMRALSKVEGNGLVVADTEPWARHRPVVQGAFHARHFSRYADLTVERTRRRLERWRPGEAFDVSVEMNELALEIVAKIVFDVDWSNEASRLREAVQIIRQDMVLDATAAIPLPDWLPLPRKFRLRRALRTLDDLLWGRIRERRTDPSGDKNDMLAIMLAAASSLRPSDGRPISDAEIRDEAATLFVAGHDTTSATLAWFWYAIARNPHVEERIVREIDAVLGDRPASIDDVPRLKYLEMAVKESMRLHPAAGFLFGRETTEEVELGGYRLPKKAWVFISPHVVHRDARLWPNPETFDPERFSPERIGDIPAYAYIPFGGGPRICMGNSLAIVEIVLLTATVLQRYRLELEPANLTVEPEIEVVSRPKGKLMVRAIPRRATSGVAKVA